MQLTDEQLVEVVPFVAFCCGVMIGQANLGPLKDPTWWLGTFNDVMTPGTRLHMEFNTAMAAAAADDAFEGIEGGMDEPPTT